MDYFFKLIALPLLIIISATGSSQASFASLLALPTISTLSTGTATTATVSATNAALWAGSAPTVAGASAIDAAYVASGAALLTKLNIGAIGSVLATVPVVASATIAASVACVASVICAASLATAGASIAYLSSHNLAPVPGGGVGTIPSATVPTNGSWKTGFSTTSYTSGASACAAVDVVFAAYHFTTTYNSTSQTCDSGACGGACSALNYTNLGTCPAGYTASGSICNLTGTPTPVPITNVQAQTSLAATPPTAAQTQSINAELAQASKDTGQNFMPAIDPNTASITAPSPVTSPTKNTVTPTGQTTSETTTTTCSQASAQSISCTAATTTSTTNITGAPTVTTTNNAPTATEPPKKTDCEVNPNRVGCLELGNVVAAETIQTKNVTATLSPTSLGAGSCPSPNVLALSGGKTLTMSYQPYCDFATMSAPLTIAFAWLSAGFIVIGSVKEG